MNRATGLRHMQIQNSRYIILAGFASVLITVVIVGATGLNQLSRFNAQQEAITNTYDAKRELVHQMLSYSRERAISLTLMVNMEDPFERDAEFMRYNSLGARFALARLRLLEAGITQEEATLLEQQGEAVSVGLEAQQHVIDLALADEREMASQLLTAEAIPWQQKVFGKLQQLADLQQSLYRERLQSEAATYSHAYLLFTALLALIATIVGGLVATLVIRQIQRGEEALSRSNERFELAMRGANDGMWDWNICDDKVYFSPRWKEMIGYAEGEIGDSVEEWSTRVHPDDLPAAEAEIQRLLDDETTQYENKHRMRHRNGVYRWHLVRGICVRDAQGQPTRMVGTTTDITERELAEDALFAEKERALVTLHSIGDAVLTTDETGSVTYLNPAAELLTGWLNEEATGKPLDTLIEMHDEHSGAQLQNPVSRCLESGTVTNLEMHTLLVDRDGKEKPITDSAAPIRDRDGTIIGAVMVCHDISDTRQMAKQMSWQASHDSLTGLINRRELERRLQQLIESTVYEGQSHAFLYLDLDQFKVVNDTSGHVAGDELLRQLSFLLKEQMRDTDTLARLGGDEFGVLLRGCPEDKARQIAESMHKTIREFRFIWRDKAFEVGASIGLVMIGPDSGSIAHVMSMADMACYAAKDLGRNRIHIYQPEDKELARRHNEMQWLADIKQALEERRFVLYRQGIAPTFDAHAPCRHAEILVRMVGEDGKMIGPDQFIPAAERYNLMSVIDRWVIENTFAFLAEHPGELDVVSINLSGNSFSDVDFHTYVQQQIARCGVSPQQICFEITETAAIANLSAAIHFIRELKKEGIRFALDDFGSGLSSFAYLKNLPVDSIKIDGAFIKDLVDDPIDRAMVEAIHSIGSVMGIKTIAEFVENEATLRQLQRIGVDMVQGYHIEKPRRLRQEAAYKSLIGQS